MKKFQTVPRKENSNKKNNQQNKTRDNDVALTCHFLETVLFF